MVSSRNFYCLKCGSTAGHKGKCEQWVNGKLCGGQRKRDDQLTEEDWEQLREKK